MFERLIGRARASVCCAAKRLYRKDPTISRFIHSREMNLIDQEAIQP